MELRKLTHLSMLLATSVVLNIIESTIPILGNIIPGSKLGLANIVVLFVIYIYAFKDAIFLSIMRVILVGILRTGLFNITFFFSLGGAVFSVIMMCIMHRFTKLSVVGVSVIGAISHSIGQIMIAVLFLKIPNLIFYLPYLLFLSIPTGVIIGMIAKKVIHYYKNIMK
ncbi:MAG TPA: Gx transporter family protein [Mollicutes bacterium]|nr:Gx transporter family protein [Mollicutes bacterium]